MKSFQFLLIAIVLILSLTSTVSAEPCDCRPGDCNQDNSIDVGDAVYVFLYVFKNGPGPTPYETCSGDPNNDGRPNVGDSVYLINYIFRSGPAPVTCEEWVETWGDYN